jgi:micrococcal nuclease
VPLVVPAAQAGSPRASRRTALLLLAGLLLAPAALPAQAFQGVVTHVTDGDTLWVRPQDGGPSVQIRLLHLDAPEGCQSFGPQATQALRERVLHRPVRVLPEGHDDYGRQLARIQQGRQDIGAWLVREGHAWSMTFRGKAGPYAGLEAQARQERRGLWAGSGALDPRSFRKQFGRCR